MIQLHIGDEGAKVRRDGKVVEWLRQKSMVLADYCGANLISGSNDGFIVVRTIVDLVNGRRVKLKIENGVR